MATLSTATSKWTQIERLQGQIEMLTRELDALTVSTAPSAASSHPMLAREYSEVLPKKNSRTRLTKTLGFLKDARSLSPSLPPPPTPSFNSERRQEVLNSVRLHCFGSTRDPREVPESSPASSGLSRLGSKPGFLPIRMRNSTVASRHLSSADLLPFPGPLPSPATSSDSFGSDIRSAAAAMAETCHMTTLGLSFTASVNAEAKTAAAPWDQDSEGEELDGIKEKLRESKTSAGYNNNGPSVIPSRPVRDRGIAFEPATERIPTPSREHGKSEGGGQSPALPRGSRRQKRRKRPSSRNLQHPVPDIDFLNRMLDGPVLSIQQSPPPSPIGASSSAQKSSTESSSLETPDTESPALNLYKNPTMSASSETETSYSLAFDETAETAYSPAPENDVPQLSPSIKRSADLENPLISKSSPTLANSESWNERWQDALRRLRHVRSDPKSDLSTVSEANAHLLNLNQDFLQTAKVFGKIIISEMYMPNDAKTIKPVSVGGVAGGQKYIIHSILFKFAVDSCGIYGGDHLLAAKVAAHELKGLMAYMSCDIPDLHVPLMALIDYRGMRLIAMSVLPISDTSLIYGSHDGGKTIRAEDPVFNRRMRYAGKKLNLARHTYRGKVLYAPTDIEGHRGGDGKYYLIDFSRTMPPVKPNRQLPGSHLYQLFRKDFVISYRTPLCSDGYSGFLIHDPGYKQMFKNIDEATTYLQVHSIAELFSTLQQKVQFAEDIQLTDEFHQTGVNMRYLGLVHSKCHMVLQSCPFTEGCEVILYIVMVEAVARVLKNLLKIKLRQTMKEFQLPMEVPYRKSIISFLNVVFSTAGDDIGKARARFFQEVPDVLCKWFNFEPRLIPPLEEYLFRDKFSQFKSSGASLIFRRLCHSTGMVFSDTVRRKFLGVLSWNPAEPFDFLDLIDIGDRVKSMTVVSLAEGTFFELKGQMLEESNFTQAPLDVLVDLYERAFLRYRSALASTPNDPNLIFSCATVGRKLLTVRSRDLDHKSVGYDASLLDLELTTRNYFNRALELIEGETRARLHYELALFHVGAHRVSEAELHFLSAIELDPISFRLLLSYGNFLLSTDRVDEGHEFLAMASAAVPLGYKQLKTHVFVVRVFGSSRSSILALSLPRVAMVSHLCQAIVSELASRFNSARKTNHHQSAALTKLLAGFALYEVSPDASGDRLLHRSERPWVTVIQRPNSTAELVFRPKAPRLIDSLLAVVPIAPAELLSSPDSQRTLRFQRVKSILRMFHPEADVDSYCLSPLEGNPVIVEARSVLSEIFERTKPVRSCLKHLKLCYPGRVLAAHMHEAAQLLAHICDVIRDDCSCSELHSQHPSLDTCLQMHFMEHSANGDQITASVDEIDVLRHRFDPGLPFAEILMAEDGIVHSSVLAEGRRLVLSLLKIYLHIIFKHSPFTESLLITEIVEIGFLHLFSVISESSHLKSSESLLHHRRHKEFFAHLRSAASHIIDADTD